MYCLFDRRINSFYTTSGNWVSIGVAKKDPSMLCIFADIGTARQCAKNSGIGFKTASVLNDDSIKKKLKLKKLDMLKPNWGIFGEIFSENLVQDECLPESHCEPDSVQANTEPALEIPQNKEVADSCTRRKRTYCELLDELDEERMYLKPETDQKKTSPLIDQTMVILSQFLELMDQWNQRMSEVGNTILSCDLKTSDELHYLEMFSTLSQEELADCSRRIQSIRHERRRAKDEKEIGNYFLLMCQAGINNDKIRHLQQICNGMESRTYRIKAPDAFVEDFEEV